MTGVRKSQKRTNSDATAEALSAQSCYTVLETSPPDYVEKISRYLESSVGQSRHDKESNDPAEAESDSGDSLFITQKPVPEAVRSGRRRHCSQRSDPSSTRYLEEGEDDSSSSSSHEESKTDKRSRTQKVKLPKYSFPFLTGRKWKSKSTLLSVPQNTALHNSAMGGFFKCVRELWQGYQRGEGVQTSLPTVDRDGELISPLSEEEEEERLESEDIKVVERKRFVLPSKSMCSQMWYTPERRDSQGKQQRKRRTTAGNAGQEMSRGRKTQHKIPAKATTSKPTALPSQSSANGDPSHKVLAERETSDEHVTNDRSILTQTETPKTKRRLTKRSKKILSQEKEMEEELHNDSDATFCETLEVQGSSGECPLKDREASPNVTEPQADVFHTDDQSQTGQAEDEPESQSVLQSLPNLVSDTNNDRMHNETRVKKKKKTKGGCESVTEGKDQSLEEPEGLRAAASANVEREETPNLSEDNRAEPPASQPGHEPEPNEENWMENSNPVLTLRQEERHIPDFKQIKKKKLAADNVGQEKEEEGNLESHVRPEKDPLFSVTCNEVNSGGEKKKKRRNRSVEDVEGEEQLQSTVISEPLNDDAETQRKKKKRKKEKEIVKMEEHEEEEASDRPLMSEMSEGQFEEMGLNCLEITEAAEEPLESGYEKKRKKHKKKKLSASHDHAQVGAEDDEDLILSNDGTLEGCTGLSVKKKKKKKKKNRESISEEVDISCSPDKDKMNSVDNSQKTEEEPDDPHAEPMTKKKKKKSKTSSRNVSEDTVTQSDDSVSVRKKEKKRTSSFLVADAEEKDAQTHEEQSSPCLAARVWGTEKPGVRAGDLQTESAELAGHLEACDDGVRKEKRKRKMSVVQESVEKDHERDFETCEAVLPETADTGVKRKKKHKRNESESVMPTERLESADDAGGSQTDEAVVVKKKKKKHKGKSRHVTPESPPAATDGVEQSAFPLVAEEIPHDSDTSDKATKETLNKAEYASPSSDTPGKSVLNNQRDGKRKEKIKSTANVLHKRKLLTEFAETETYKIKKEKRNQPITPSSTVFSETSPSQFKTSFSDSTVKNKHKMAKRRLHNPSEDFLIDDV